jgi:hypothetical protein
LTQDFKLANGLAAPDYFGDPDVRFIGDFSLMYTHTVEALEFYKNVLKANVDYKLPIDVFGYARGTSTLYTPTTSSVLIIVADSPMTDSNRPRNREYHEFSHHVMFTMYGGWPAPPAGAVPAEENHAGYTNPTTSDSYVEGFAEFMALVISDYYKQPNPDVYASFGSFEVNWKSWSRRGLYEELAVAGVLWDLYDGLGDEKANFDTLQIWNVLKDKRENFGEVYDALITKFPGKKKEIDKVFELHGFWIDKTPGTGTYDSDEAFRDANGNNRWNAGEYFVDYAREEGTNRSFMIRQDDEKIGYATNYQRLARKNTVRIRGEYLKVDNSVPLYQVKVAFAKDPTMNYENLADNENGLVYVNVPEEGALVSVVPLDSSGKPISGKSFSITSADFEKKFGDAQVNGYFAEYTFGVTSPPAQPMLPAASADDMGRPYWEVKTVKADPKGYTYQSPQDEPLPSIGAGSGLSSGIATGISSVTGKNEWIVPVIIGIVVVGLVVAIILILKKKKKKRQQPAGHKIIKQKKNQ